MTQDQETEQLDVGRESGASPVSPAGPMAGEDPAMSRILRREMHSSRAGAAGIAAVLVIIVCAYALLEAGVRAIGQPPWLIDFGTAAERIIALPEGVPPLLLGAGGAVIAMVGLFFLLHALLPGRRARHLLRDRRAAVVVDDEVLASALARRARTAANVTREQVMVVVSRQMVVVNVRPTSGSAVSDETVLAAVKAELEEMSPVPMPDVRVNVAESGVIGA